MIGTIKILDNVKEVNEYNAVIEEHGEEEAFNLGLYTKPPVKKFSKSDFLFNVKDIKTAWVFLENGEKFMSLHMRDDNVWSLYYDEELWNKLRKYYEEN